MLLLLIGIEQGLLAIPWWLLIAFLVGLAWLATRDWKLPAVVLVALLFLGVMDLWEDAIATMALMIAATLTAIVISLPVGIVMARSKGVRSVMTPILDLMQTMPSFVYLIPTVMIFGPGKVPALLATIIYAAPPLVRLTDLGIRMVDPAVMEAARAFGTNPAPAPVRRANSAGDADHSRRHQPDHDDGAGHGGDRLDDRCRRAWLSGAAGHRPARGQPRACSRGSGSWRWPSSSTASPRPSANSLQERIGLAETRI